MKIKYQFIDRENGYTYTTIARNKYEARVNILREMYMRGYYILILFADIKEVI